MDFAPQYIFCLEIKSQCTFALMAYEDLKQALSDYNQPRPTPPVPNSTDAAQVRATEAKHDQWLVALEKHQQMKAAAADRVWYSIQAFLIAAGNISKLLCPHYRKGENRLPGRGPHLKATLGVEENSPLMSRELRNHFEHFDIRLEEWAVSSVPRVFIDGNIGPLASIKGGQPTDVFRNFDPKDFAVIFQGHRYFLLPIVGAIEQLSHKATVQLQQRASA